MTWYSVSDASEVKKCPKFLVFEESVMHLTRQGNAILAPIITIFDFAAPYPQTNSS